MKTIKAMSRIFLIFLVVLTLGRFDFSGTAKAAGTSVCTDAYCRLRGEGTLKNVGDHKEAQITDADGTEKNLSFSNDIEWVYIESGANITVYGALRFKNLKISTATVTQEGIQVSDISSTGGLRPAGLEKKVDLIVDNELIITNKAKIDVTGKGFPGGVRPATGTAHENGYGPGGGTSGAGGSHGGKGGGESGPVYDDEGSPTQPGSGGAWYGTIFGGKSGGAGGGVIQLRAKNITFDRDIYTVVKADGSGSDCSGVGPYRQCGGTGAGGSINIQAETLSSTVDGSGKAPSVAGGNFTNYYTRGADGKFYASGHSDYSYGESITSKGGSNLYSSGYGGGGGLISVKLDSAVATSCVITATVPPYDPATVPASCEDRAVTIQGFGFIDMSAVKVYQTGTNAKMQCGDSDADKNDPNCDSKRHFTSLTIDGSTVTHAGITTDDMRTQDIHGGGPNNSLADETTGTARWKKVDVVTTGDTILRNKGKIDVAGKGYPGGITLSGITGDDAKCDINSAFGPGRAFMKDERIFANPVSYAVFGDGAGFGGLGGLGRVVDRSTPNYSIQVRTPGSGQMGNTYEPIKQGATDETYLEWGSGGACTVNQQTGEEYNVDWGGNGGGAVRLVVGGNLEFKNTAEIYINAAGGDGQTKQNDGGWDGSGGGSGGFILISTNSIVYGGSETPRASGLKWLGQVGRVDTSADLNRGPVYADGGKSSSDGLGGGGGGGYIKIIPYASTVTSSIESRNVQVIVTWKERGVDKSVELNTVLRNVVGP